MMPHADVRDELLERRRASEGRGRRLEKDVDLHEAGALEPACRRLDVREVPGIHPVGEIRREARVAHQPNGARVQDGDVRPAAALRDQPSARPEGGRDRSEERVVIRNPVEGRGAEDRIERAGERQRRPIGQDERDV